MIDDGPIFEFDDGKKDDTAALICTRCADMQNPVPGARVVQCDTCNEDVWLAPSSDRGWKKNKITEVICGQCLLDKIEAGEIPNFMPLNADQIQELRDMYKMATEEQDAKRSHDGAGRAGPEGQAGRDAHPEESG